MVLGALEELRVRVDVRRNVLTIVGCCGALMRLHQGADRHGLRI